MNSPVFAAFLVFDPKTNQPTTECQAIALRTAAPTNKSIFLPSDYAHTVAQRGHGLVGLSSELDELEEGVNALKNFLSTFARPVGFKIDFDQTSKLAIRNLLTNILEELGDIYWYMQISEYHYHADLVELEKSKTCLFAIPKVPVSPCLRLAEMCEGTAISFGRTADLYSNLLLVANGLSDLIAKVFRPAMGELLSQSKREMFYGKKPAFDSVSYNLERVNVGLVAAIQQIYGSLPSSFESTYAFMRYLIQSNIYKLAARYMDAEWTPETCFNRDTHAELSTYKLEDIFNGI